MARLIRGSEAPRIVLPAVDGTMYDTVSLAGRRHMISFFRFATCPFCNLRLHRLIERREEWGADFPIVAIFDSPLEVLVRSSEKHDSPFPILADEDNRQYRAYGVERSSFGVLKGMITRLPTLLIAMFKHGYLPIPVSGDVRTMPLDVLVNEEGTIHTAYYGADEGDHLPFEELVAFARGTA